MLMVRYGQISFDKRRIFMKRAKQMVKIDSWKEYFEFCSHPVPSARRLVKMLKDAFNESLQENYHNVCWSTREREEDFLPMRYNCYQYRACTVKAFQKPNKMLLHNNCKNMILQILTKKTFFELLLSYRIAFHIHTEKSFEKANKNIKIRFDPLKYELLDTAPVFLYFESCSLYNQKNRKSVGCWNPWPELCNSKHLKFDNAY